MSGFNKLSRENILKGADDFSNIIGTGAGDTQSGANAQEAIKDSQNVWKGLAPADLKPVDYHGATAADDAIASQVGPSAMNGVHSNANYTKAQMAQMGALQDLAAHGGRNAASDANLAAIQSAENQNARGQREAIMQNANARGMGGSGASLLAQLSGSQGAVDRQSAQDLGVRGQEANTALSAGMGAANLGSNLENQQFGEGSAVAQANDAAARFNAGNSTNVSLANMGKNQHVNDTAADAYNNSQTMNNYQMPQTTYQNSLQKAQGQTGSNAGAAGYYGGVQSTNAQTSGNKLGAITGLVTAGINGATKKAPVAAAAMAHGGRIGGIPRVPGDSELNDTEPKMTSPGEVVVPRSLALGGSSSEIGHFVHHAPTIHAPGDRNKEAMLSALKHLAGRRAA